MLSSVRPILTEPAATAIIVIDQAGGASLSQIARTSERALSTVQRAVERLIAGGVLRHTTPRGPLVFRPDAPKQSLTELARWTLGKARASELTDAAKSLKAKRVDDLPPTIKSRAVRQYLPQAIERIVSEFHPQRVILFGSQGRGEATRDSDVDLLVVFDRQVDRRERQIEIGKLLKNAPFAKDVLVASTNDLPNAVRGTAVAEAFHDGVVVYER